MGKILQRGKYRHLFKNLKWICTLFTVPIFSQEVCSALEWTAEVSRSSWISEAGSRRLWVEQMSGTSLSCNQFTEQPRTSIEDKQSRRLTGITELTGPSSQGKLVKHRNTRADYQKNIYIVSALDDSKNNWIRNRLWKQLLSPAARFTYTMTLQGGTVNTASYLPFQWLSTTGRFVFEDFTRQDIIPSLAEIFNLNFAMSLFSMYY